jgi:hypothetical protein
MKLVVEFHGICTFVSNLFLPGLGPVPWRAVLVNAENETDVRGIPIGAHLAKVTIESTGEHISLQGYQMYLTSSGEVSPLVPQPNFFLLPNLTNLMREVEPLGPPGEIVVNPTPETVAAYFDLTIGTVTAGLSERFSATTVLTVETPGTLTLHLETFDGQPHRTIEFSRDDTLLVGNTDEHDPTGPSGADFLLHYLTASVLPLVPQVPQQIKLPFIKAYETVGAGCSNSQYP